MKIQKYRRGQIWWYNNNAVWDGGTYNQGKSRPVILVSNELANANSNTLIAIPCTSQDKKEMSTHTTFEINGISNVAMAECLMSVSIDKLGAYIGTVDNELMEKLEGNILVALGMKNVIKENAVKRCNCNNVPSPTNPIPIEKQMKNYDIVDNEPVNVEMNYVKPNELTLKMVEDMKHNTKENEEIKDSKKFKPMTLEEKKQFLKEYNSRTKKYMINKYDLKNEAVLFQKAYNIRKQLSALQENKKGAVSK